MERIEVSFKNKAVRVWFYSVFPAIIIAIMLFIILPYEQNQFVSIGLSLMTIFYFMWYFICFKRKRK